MTDLTLSTQPLSEVNADVVVIATAPGDDGPVLLGGSSVVDDAFGSTLTSALAAVGATGKEGDLARLPAPESLDATLVLAVGVGSTEPDDETFRRALGVAVRAAAGRTRVAVAVNGPAGPLAEGALLGAYSFEGYRETDPKRTPVQDVVLLGIESDGDDAAGDHGAAAAVQRAEVVVRSVALARDLVNTPPGDLAPCDLAERARADAAVVGVGAEIWDVDALTEQGFGGILGVGKGSSRPPRLVRLTWRPESATKTVALVGKGITFDSGGLSLKPATSMEWMKTDMAGAAAVLATVLAAARLELPVNVTGWLPLAENLPGGSAQRPGDVLTQYGGKRVEVLNTDAEGRLVLADALVRAAEEEPDAMVDVATLTGAQIVALGMRTTGIMANDDDWRAEVASACAQAGEDAWPMPLPKELRKGLDSPIADLANVPAGGSRDGGMLTAGHYLAAFVPHGLPWAHLDIAGPSWNPREPYGYTPKGATGVAVRALVTLLERQTG
ncbi:MAG TPA: leucyl aminopeptidase [Frankiaceae bacterium]|nr:leucyl aminopeptidase [Frankiaceae bacterium]